MDQGARGQIFMIYVHFILEPEKLLNRFDSFCGDLLHNVKSAARCFLFICCNREMACIFIDLAIL